ncbi:shootin-1-like isoform X2 [Pelobates fuscus]|uniref:shootin-1-like isoform X2 n=1 Tax=Pelobates fuscus TaxID=191477 RepID=UPI002FE470A7
MFIVEHMLQKTPEKILSPLRMVQEITNSISDTSCNCQEQVKAIPVIHEMREDTLTPHIKDLDHIQKAADTTREEIFVVNKQPEQISSDKSDTDVTNKGTDFKNSQQIKDEGSKELLAEGKEVMESIDQSVNAEEGDQHPVKAMPEAPASEEFIKEDNTDQTIDNAQDYQQQLKILQETITRLIEDKRKAFLQIDDLNNEIRKVEAELENERQEGKSLLRTLAKNQRMFQKLNRVSVMVSHEYNDMVQQLELQENLRQEAEHLAHTMLIEKQAANRQSMLLMQNVEPSVMLVHALEEVRRLTCALDETKQELQTKVVSLESQLTERPSQEEFDLIREELKATSKEKRALHDQLKEAKETCSLLEGKIKALEEHKKKEESLSSGNDELVTEAPIPPPPPVPPPPRPTLPHNCSENALTLIRHRRRSKEAGLATLKPAKNVDVKADAMKEMVERIKNGVVLRPARKEGQKHTQAINKRKSVINEFKGIFTDTVRKPNQRKSFRRASKKVAENELDGILRRRRKKVDCAETDGSAETTDKQEKKVEECAPGNNMHVSDLKSTLNPGSTQKNPIVVKLRQKSSSLQKSRRTLLDYE